MADRLAYLYSLKPSCGSMVVRVVNVQSNKILAEYTVIGIRAFSCLHNIQHIAYNINFVHLRTVIPVKRLLQPMR